ncbi:type IV pilin [Zobellella taiwanensis]|uniref:Type II secretion system protein H n=1 Tax=Zobellella taiwanensis TaxID=347535 RepID=A0A2P7QMV5_9GAMM|nr:GspH/FimT family pseudopilin [Zobellella taiwanensis]PSJ39298.1 type IV pilin [Zobellella taiwanensis]
MTRVQAGLTLVELLVGIAVMAVLLTLAVPSFQSLRQQYQVRSAGMAVYADLQLARSEAIKRNRAVSLCFTNSDSVDWLYRLYDSDECSGTEIESTDSRNYPSIHLKSNIGTKITFRPRRNTFFAGNITVKNGSYEMKVVVSSSGRIRTCSEHNLLGVPSSCP